MVAVELIQPVDEEKESEIMVFLAREFVKGSDELRRSPWFWVLIKPVQTDHLSGKSCGMRAVFVERMPNRRERRSPSYEA